jgi:hypothetical protein
MNATSIKTLNDFNMIGYGPAAQCLMSTYEAFKESKSLDCSPTALEKIRDDMAELERLFVSITAAVDSLKDSNFRMLLSQSYQFLIGQYRNQYAEMMQYAAEHSSKDQGGGEGGGDSTESDVPKITDLRDLEMDVARHIASLMIRPPREEPEKEASAEASSATPTARSETEDARLHHLEVKMQRMEVHMNRMQALADQCVRSVNECVERIDAIEGDHQDIKAHMTGVQEILMQLMDSVSSGSDEDEEEESDSESDSELEEVSLMNGMH